MDESNKNIQIFLNNDDTKKLENASTYELYVINQNEKLQQNQYEMKLELVKAESGIETRDDEIDSLESRISNTKNILKNLNCMRDLSDSVSKFNISDYNDLNLYIKTYKNKCLRHLRVLESIFLLYMGLLMSMYNFIDVFYLIFFSLFCLAFQESSILNLNVPTRNNRRIDLKNKEIADILKTSDFLHEYIESL